jgi:prepilin-type N-terminal cleavage/methylation domain-containing protein
VGKYLKKIEWQAGYSLIEITLVISVVALLLGLVTLNLFQFQHSSQLSATVSSFLADFKEQQIKSMVGDTGGTGGLSNYGVSLGTTSYTEFQNSLGTANFVVSLPSGIQFSTTFPSSQILFLKGSGEVSGFTSGQNTITLKDTVNNTQKIITVNRYGVVTGVN